MWDLHSLTRGQTHVPCIGRQLLNQWTTREVTRSILVKSAWWVYDLSLLAYIHKLLSFFATLKFLFRHCRISCLVVAESELLVGLVLLSVASAGPVSLCVSFLIVPCFLAVVSFSELFIFLRYLPLRSIWWMGWSRFFQRGFALTSAGCLGALPNKKSL